MTYVPPQHADPVEVIIADTVRNLRAKWPDIQRSMAYDPDFSLHVALGENTPLAAAVAADPSFGDLRNGWFSFAGGGYVCQPHALPFLFIRTVLAGEGPSDVVARARDFAVKKTSGGDWYAALIGVAVAEVCPLADGVDLVPWDAVPKSPQKHRLDNPADVRDALTAFRPKPNCALRIRLAERQVLYRSAMEAPLITDPENDDINIANERLHDVVRSISLLTGRPVSMMCAWTHPHEWVLQHSMALAVQFGGALNDPYFYALAMSPLKVERTDIVDVYSKLQGFRGRDKAALSIGLDRIGAAVRLKGLADKAIDLGIALEVLLLHDIGNAGEFGFRMALRVRDFLEEAQPSSTQILNALRTHTNFVRRRRTWVALTEVRNRTRRSYRQSRSHGLSRAS